MLKCLSSTMLYENQVCNTAHPNLRLPDGRIEGYDESKFWYKFRTDNCSDTKTSYFTLEILSSENKINR